MGENERGVRDGSGPYEDSYRQLGEGKDIGRRKEAGEPCPSPKDQQPARLRRPGEPTKESE